MQDQVPQLSIKDNFGYDIDSLVARNKEFNLHLALNEYFVGDWPTEKVKVVDADLPLLADGSKPFLKLLPGSFKVS
jgi:hypothetical protein